VSRKSPGVYLRGRVWWISYYDAFGRRHFESVGTSYQQAVRARAARLGDIAAGRFGLRRGRKAPTLREFVEGQWRKEVAIGLKPSTLRGYESGLFHHLLPYFGDWPLPAISRAAVKAFIAKKAQQQRVSHSKRNPNPNRPTLSQKTIHNTVAVLSAILETAAVDYELLSTNPLRGILRRKNFPTDAMRPRDRRIRVLEPEDFKRAVMQLNPRSRRIVVVAALTGLRWGELVGLRREDVNFPRNKIRVTRSLYKGIPQTPKSEQSVRDIDMGPIVRRILHEVPWSEGLVFSSDGTTPIGGGPWLKQQWRRAQKLVGVRQPIRWHDLRHQYVSLLIASGKSPKYIAEQAGHASAGFTLDRYGHLFASISTTPVEWPEDLLWPEGSRLMAETTLAKVDQVRT
jgi:integrase